LSRDNIWDRDEIEAVYGVHHVYSQAKSADEEAHKKKADTIVNTVLAKLDKDRNGKVSLAELEAGGLDALPSFAHLGAEGHVSRFMCCFMKFVDRLLPSTTTWRAVRIHNFKNSILLLTCDQRVFPAS
jgi:hypothetical protein